jgi:hypothetical protein
MYFVLNTYWKTLNISQTNLIEKEDLRIIKIKGVKPFPFNILHSYMFEHRYRTSYVTNWVFPACIVFTGVHKDYRGYTDTTDIQVECNCKHVIRCPQNYIQRTDTSNTKLKNGCRTSVMWARRWRAFKK